MEEEEGRRRRNKILVLQEGLLVQVEEQGLTRHLEPELKLLSFASPRMLSVCSMKRDLKKKVGLIIKPHVDSYIELHSSQCSPGELQ